MCSWVGGRPRSAGDSDVIGGYRLPAARAEWCREQALRYPPSQTQGTIRLGGTWTYRKGGESMISGTGPTVSEVIERWPLPCEGTHSAAGKRANPGSTPSSLPSARPVDALSLPSVAQHRPPLPTHLASKPVVSGSSLRLRASNGRLAKGLQWALNSSLWMRGLEAGDAGLVHGAYDGALINQTLQPHLPSQRHPERQRCVGALDKTTNPRQCHPCVVDHAYVEDRKVRWSLLEFAATPLLAGSAVGDALLRPSPPDPSRCALCSIHHCSGASVS